MQAIGKYILLKEEKEPTAKTSGGLLLNEKSREDLRYRKGVIVNIGTDVNGVEVTNEVFFDKQAGFSLEIEEELYTVIKEHDVVIVL